MILFPCEAISYFITHSFYLPLDEFWSGILHNKSTTGIRSGDW